MRGHDDRSFPDGVSVKRARHHKCGTLMLVF